MQASIKQAKVVTWGTDRTGVGATEVPRLTVYESFCALSTLWQGLWFLLGECFLYHHQLQTGIPPWPGCDRQGGRQVEVCVCVRTCVYTGEAGNGKISDTSGLSLSCDGDT